MKPTWIVVANAARAQIYQRQSDSAPIEAVESLVHPESRLRSADLKDDQLGRTITDVGGHASYSPPMDAKEKEQDRFARQIADCLKAGDNAGRYGTIHLFASDRMLGAIRHHLDASLAARVGCSKAVDLTAFTGRELEGRIAEHSRG